MTGPRIASFCLVLLLSIRVQPLAACEIPLGLFIDRFFPQMRMILEGEVVFVADARLHDFEGQTTAVSGVVMTKGLQDAVGCVAIQAKALDTGISRRNRLMWEDYLEVGKFPEIRFILTGLADLRKDAGVVGVILEGEIALHGVTKDLRIPVTLILGDRGLEVKGKTTLKMSDYAIERPSFLFITVKDEVDVRFRVVVGETE